MGLYPVVVVLQYTKHKITYTHSEQHITHKITNTIKYPK
jgi:hypothetical protein